MNNKAKFLLSCVAGALVIGTGPTISGALAQTAMAAAEPVPFWWFHGEIEAGGRAYINNPQKDGRAGPDQNGKSTAKFDEYGTHKPGAIVNGNVSTGTQDGLYQVDLTAKDIGYNNERFNVDASKAGQHYFNFQWDQTPHLYSNSAQTIYNGVGSNSLTLPAGIGAALYTASGALGYWPCIALSATAGNNCNPAVGQPYRPGGVAGVALTAGQAAAMQQVLNNNMHQTDIGIRRDTASVEYRWTPTDNWDIRADYTRIRRTGTQVDNIVMSPGTSGVMMQVPKPVADTTQNFGINGEYAGTSPWGKNFNIKLAYGGSTYTDDNASYTAQNPFCDPGAVNGPTCARWGSPSNPTSMMSLPPSNQSNGFSTTIGADLPAKSRYMGTVSYTMMRQNAAFLPYSLNANVFNDTIGLTTIPTPGVPYSSLNGAINTLLSNNVVTTQITPDLKSKLSYRYYNYDNNTPELLFSPWVLTDAIIAGVQSAGYNPVHSLAISYTKQNAAAELNWRPTRSWNLGVGYGFERYNWTRADADATNEPSGKFYTDWTPAKWITARASVFYSQRHYNNYDYLTNVGTFQWPTAGGARYNPAYRQFYLDNRERNKGQLSVSVDLIPRLTITPTFGWKIDDYRLNITQEEGLERDHSWTAGIEAAYLVTPYTKLLVSYMNEQHSQIINSAGTTNPATASGTAYTTTNVQDTVNTFMIAADHAFIPDKFNVAASYTVSQAVDHQPTYGMNGSQIGSGIAGIQYPDVKTLWMRFETTAKYKFDRETVQKLGWNGDVTAKLRYAWERNSVANWENDVMQTYMYSLTTSTAYMSFLAGNNPNYSVQLITASLSWKW